MKQKLQLYKNSKQDKIITLSSKLEAVTEELADLKCKHECLSSDRELTAYRLAGEVEILTQRESYLGRYCEQLSNELLTIRKERTVINSRLSALVEENVNLRARIWISNNHAF
uniref:Uncharacterized protein n=1 Tax=Heterorhabditis bacteriophora TaxID=37862 RepID=A0A1I7WAS8_HETBA